MAKMKHDNPEHWVNRICNDYGINENQLSEMSEISQSTLATSRKRGSRLSSIDMERKLKKNLGFNDDDIEKYR